MILFKKNAAAFLRIGLLIFITFFGLSCSDKITDSTIAVDNQKLDEAFLQAQQIQNLKSLVVFHSGKIIKEAFYRDGGAESPHDVRSVTKSVIGLLIGIAIEKGFIPSVDQTIGTYLSPLVQNLSTEKANIKISHLLTMSSGFDWYELGGVGYNEWITSNNQVEFVLDKAIVSQPGQLFNYNSGALHLLSVIISRASGMSTLNFAKQYLFVPLDIDDRTWSTDKQGLYNGSAGLKITPHDMVKIGQLILNGGAYNGKRIVSSQWIEKIIISKITTNSTMPFASGYSYCWWTDQNSKGSYTFANGYGGQFIFVVPNLKLVVVATNQWSGVESSVANDQWYRTMDLIISQVLSAFD